jgi:hypothetical protein
MSFIDKDKLPDNKKLRSARKEFEDLLARKTIEPDWQRFFTEHPYILSISLPLKLEPRDIIPLARQGVTEPDFIFYPKRITPTPFYGVIELKKPDSKIVTVTRSNVAILSRDADTAIEQTKAYSDSIMKRDNVLFLGNNLYLFVIMGMSTDITSKLSSSLHHEMIQNKLPKNLQILPYDYLYQRFDQEIPPKLHVLVPDVIDQYVKTKTNLVKNIEDLELSVRTYNALRLANINTLDDLVNKTEQELLRTEHFGRKSLNELKEIVNAIDLDFMPDVKTDK